MSDLKIGIKWGVQTKWLLHAKGDKSQAKKYLQKEVFSDLTNC